MARGLRDKGLGSLSRVIHRLQYSNKETLLFNIYVYINISISIMVTYNPFFGWIR